jgi:hypothetical protein
VDCDHRRVGLSTMFSSSRRVLRAAPKGDAMGCIVSLNIRSGGGTRAARLSRYLDQLDPDTILLTEWRDNTSGRGTPRKAIAFGSTTLLAMAHSSQRPPQSALTIIAAVKPDWRITARLWFGLATLPGKTACGRGKIPVATLPDPTSGQPLVGSSFADYSAASFSFTGVSS